eukprot:g49502.t1
MLGVSRDKEACWRKRIVLRMVGWKRWRGKKERRQKCCWLFLVATAATGRSDVSVQASEGKPSRPPDMACSDGAPEQAMSSRRVRVDMHLGVANRRMI